MTYINLNLVKELRLKSGVGIVDCKNALINSGGDIDKAMLILKKQGNVFAEKKSKNLAMKGLVCAFTNDSYGYLLELNCETDFVEKHNDFIDFANKILFYLSKNNIKSLRLVQEYFKELRIQLITKFGENIVIRRISVLKGIVVNSYLYRNKIGVLISSNSKDSNLIKNISMHIIANNPIYLTRCKIPCAILDNEYNIQFEIAKISGKSEFISNKIAKGRVEKFIKSVCLLEQSLIMDSEKLIKNILKKNNITVFNFSRFEIGEEI